MTSVPMFNLGKYLREHQLSAYALVREVDGKVPASTVYGLARKPVRRIDLPVVYTLLDALQRMRGQAVDITEVIERQENETSELPALPTLEELLAQIPKRDPGTFKRFSYDRSREPISIGPDGPSIVDLISEGRDR